MVARRLAAKEIVNEPKTNDFKPQRIAWGSLSRIE